MILGPDFYRRNDVNTIAQELIGKLLGINHRQSGQQLILDQKSKSNQKDSVIWIEDRSFILKNADIDITPRIGVNYAGSDALLPVRYIYKKSL